MASPLQQDTPIYDDKACTLGVPMRFVLGRRSSDAGGSVFSKLAAGVSLTPLKDLAFAAADAIRAAFFGSGKTLVGFSNRSRYPVVLSPAGQHERSSCVCRLMRVAAVQNAISYPSWLT